MPNFLPRGSRSTAKESSARFERDIFPRLGRLIAENKCARVAGTLRRTVTRHGDYRGSFVPYVGRSAPMRAMNAALDEHGRMVRELDSEG